MTPKEKAQDLMAKVNLEIPMDAFITDTVEIANQKIIRDHEASKAIALIIVDEIIATDLLVDEEDYAETTTYLPYWLDVKKEILAS